MFLCGLWAFCTALAAQLETVPRNNNPYGTTSHLTRTGYAARQSLCAKLAESGAGWMRMDFDWDVLERDPGRWDFARYDDILSTAESNGIQVVGILSSPPDRFSRVWEHLDAWGRFVGTVAARYRGRIPVYEIWNEEDSRAFWHFEPNETNYLAVLETSYKTLKAVDPSVRVTLGSLTKRGLPFAERLYRIGASKWFDIMNVHPYSTRPERPHPEGDLDVWLAKLKGVMSRFGDSDKEIWMTEIGWPAPHRVRFAVPGLLRAGLREIDPHRKTWNALVVDLRFENVSGGDALLDLVRGELPNGSNVFGCGFSSFVSALAEKAPDLVVVSPRSETYPDHADMEIVSFVRRGGVVAELGGMPFHRGTGKGAGRFTSDGLRRALHFDARCWWMQEEAQMPKTIRVHPSVPGVECSDKGVEAGRFLSDRFLEPGDKFVPLLRATWTNGADCVAAAAISLANGGGVVISGVRESFVDIYTEREQALYLPRAHLLAFDAGVSTVMWYELRSHDYDRQDNGWGLLHADLSEKLAWKAYQELIRQRPAGSRPLPTAPIGEGFHHIGWLRPDGRKAGALWTENLSKSITIALGHGDFSFVDFRGNPIWPEKADDGWRLVVSDKICYYLEKE